MLGRAIVRAAAEAGLDVGDAVPVLSAAVAVATRQT